MFIKQLSIFVENKPGRLAAVTKMLKDNGIDIRALSIADTKDFGILRLIVNDTEKASEALKNADCTVSVTNVVGMCINDKSGALADAMDTLYKANVSVEYMYAFVTRQADTACVILRTDSSERAVEALTEAGYRIATASDIDSL